MKCFVTLGILAFAVVLSGKSSLINTLSYLIPSRFNWNRRKRDKALSSDSWQAFIDLQRISLSAWDLIWLSESHEISLLR